VFRIWGRQANGKRAASSGKLASLKPVSFTPRGLTQLDPQAFPAQPGDHGVGLVKPRRQQQGVVRTTLESNHDVLLGQADPRRGVDEVAEQVPGLRHLVTSTEALRQQPVLAADHRGVSACRVCTVSASRIAPIGRASWQPRGQESFPGVPVPRQSIARKSGSGCRVLLVSDAPQNAYDPSFLRPSYQPSARAMRSPPRSSALREGRFSGIVPVRSSARSADEPPALPQSIPSP
jgi:hypothetical protein